MAVSFLPQSSPISLARPDLALIQGGRAPEAVALRSLYLRRRILAGIVVVLLVAALVGLGSLLMGAPATAGTITAATITAQGGPVVSGSYEVVAGDTLWGIAEALNPRVDRRVAVELLVAANGSESINPGQVLIVPAEIGAI